MRWIQTFVEKHAVVSHDVRVKILVSTKLELIHREVLRHLCVVQCALSSNELDEDVVFNADETNFVFDMANGRPLAHMGYRNVNYSVVVSGKSGMTMVVMLSGCRPAFLQSPFLAFQNPTTNYPITGVLENVVGVSNCTQPKGWMYNRVFLEWLTERPAIDMLIHGNRRVLYMDNCGRQNRSEEFSEA